MSKKDKLRYQKIARNFGRNLAKLAEGLEISVEILRRQNLGLSDNEKLGRRRYEFNLPADTTFLPQDEEKMKRLLEDYGSKIFKRGKYRVCTTDREIKQHEGTWAYLELRQPAHLGYVDSISINNDARLGKRNSISISFIRGQRELSSSKKRKVLDDMAYQISGELAEEIKLNLSFPEYYLKARRARN